MRIIVLFCFLLTSNLVVFAQSESDRIYRIDKSHFEVIIDEITDTELIYYLATDATKSKPLRIARGEVWKIVFSDGETEIITPIKEVLVSPLTGTKKNIPESTETPAVFRPGKSKLKNAHLDRHNNKRPSFVIGGEVAYVTGNHDWNDDRQGMGMKLGIGASAKLTLPITSWLAASLSGGFLKWEVQRNFKDSLSRELLFERVNTFNMIPVHLGIKLYPANGFYISPQAGYTFYHETGTDKKPEAEPNTFFEFKGGKPGYRIELGYEYQIGHFMINAGVSYSSLLISKMNEFSNISSLNYAGGKIAIGYKF